jgi:hypothetical protein
MGWIPRVGDDISLVTNNEELPRPIQIEAQIESVFWDLAQYPNEGTIYLDYWYDPKEVEEEFDEATHV